MQLSKVFNLGNQKDHARHEKGRRLNPNEIREAFWGYLFILPNLFGFIVFLIGPIIASLYYSLTQWDLINSPIFIGLENYKILFTDKQFITSARNTLVYSAMYIPIGIMTSLGLALVMNQKLKGVNFFRAVYFLPVIASMVGVAIVWRWILNTDYGILNYVLSLVGIPPISWLSNRKIVLFSVALVGVWKSMGYNMVIFLAGLKGIPQHLYEAASIDGAGRIKRFLYITVPLLTPTLFFVSVMMVIGSFQVFDVVYMMTHGGPGDASRVYYYWLWQNAFNYFRMGYASAMAWLLFIALFVITLLQVKFLGSRIQYEMG